jgi:predicted GTPase
MDSKQEVISMESKTDIRVSVAVTGRYGSGREALIGALFGQAAPVPDVRPEGERPIRITFGDEEKDAAFDCVTLPDSAWAKRKLAVYDYDPRQFDDCVSAGSLPHMDAVVYTMSAVFPFVVEDRDNLARLSGTPTMIVLTALEYLSQEERAQVLDISNQILSEMKWKRITLVSGDGEARAAFKKLVDAAVRRNLPTRDARAKIERGLAAVRKALDAGLVSEAKRDAFRASHAAIERRYGDPTLNLAVIGEYNAGKSTFINRMMNMDLLKSSVLPTTAAPTYIRPADVPAPALTVRDKDGACWRLDDPEARAAFSARCGAPLPDTLSDVIAAITVGERFSDVMDDITLELPAGARMDHLQIIDTPGVNPGAMDAAAHRDRTVGVLREKADAVLFVLSGAMVYTRSFEEFIQENAARFVENALFVVNKMDMVPEADRAPILEFVRGRIRARFGVEPRVYACSALDAATDANWEEPFSKMRGEILNFLAKSRQGILRARVRELLGTLVEELESDLSGQKAALEARLETAARNAPPILSTTLDQVLERCLAEKEKALAAVRGEITARQAGDEKAVIRAVKGKLDKLTTRTDITDFTKDPKALQAIILEETRPIAESVDGAVRAYADLVSAQSQRVVETLRAHYRDLASGGVDQLPDQEEDTFHAASVEDVLKHVAQSVTREKEDNISLMAGVAVGAVIMGLIVGGPIAILVGVVGGWMGGNRLFVNAQRDRAYSKYRQVVPDIVLKVGIEYGNFANKQMHGMRTEIERQLNTLLSDYKDVFRRLSKEHAASQKALEEQTHRLNATLEALRARLSELSGRSDSAPLTPENDASADEGDETVIMEAGE